MFDVLIIGGGVSGVSCALVLGSARKKEFAKDKKIGIIAHQKTSSLQNGVYNNAYGIPKGKLGSELMSESLAQLSDLYPDVVQIENEKVLAVTGNYPNFEVVTNKSSYKTKNIVVAIGASNTFAIDGLMEFVDKHPKAIPEKQKIWLKNSDLKVVDGIYVAGTLAGLRSQLAIAAGSGAAIATDILTFWNDGIDVQIHDSVVKK